MTKLAIIITISAVLNIVSLTLMKGLLDESIQNTDNAIELAESYKKQLDEIESEKMNKNLQMYAMLTEGM